MLYTVSFLGRLGIVPFIHSTYKISCDTSYSFKALVAVVFCPVAAWALVVYDACEAAYRVSVYRVVDGAVAYAALLHASYHLLESVQILARISVKLNIRYMSAVGQCMIRSLKLDLIESTYVIVNRYMERVGVVFSVSNTFYDCLLYTSALFHPS